MSVPKWLCLLLLAVPARGRDLRVITYNVHYGGGPTPAAAAADAGYMKEIAGLILRQHPDVVALQEVNAGPKAGFINQRVLLEQQTGFTVRYKEAMHLHGNSSGIALLTPHPILEERLIEVMEEGDYLPPNATKREHAERRLAQAAFIRIPDWGTTWFVNTHFHSGDGFLRRSNYVALQRQLVAKLAGPVVILGDFNSRAGNPETSYGQRILKNAEGATFQDALDAVGKQTACTYPATNLQFRLDWIYYNPKYLAVSNAFVTGWQQSDHEAIVAVFKKVRPRLAPVSVGLLGVGSDS